MEGWRAGIEGWKAGGLEAWRAGRLEGWKVGRLEGLDGWRALRLPDLNRSFTLPLSSLGLGRPPHI